MLVPLKHAELHNPLFLSGTNLQMKLDPSKRDGLDLVYDREEKELLVTYKDDTAIIPSSNVASMIPGTVVKPKAITHHAVATIKAQVSTPQDHVFAGPGQGKTK